MSACSYIHISIFGRKNQGGEQRKMPRKKNPFKNSEIVALIIQISQPGFIHVRIESTANQGFIGELWEK